MLSADEPANRDICFQVQEGEIFGILGDNGAGKTTLIKQMVNLLTSDSGDILLYGQPIRNHSLYLPSLVGYMPQENLRAESADRRGSALLQRASAGHEAAGPPSTNVITCSKSGSWRDLRDHNSSRLSGGQRRLLRLAVATAAASKVLVLDEPTNDLDPQKRRLVWDESAWR